MSYLVVETLFKLPPRYTANEKRNRSGIVTDRFLLLRTENEGSRTVNKVDEASWVLFCSTSLFISL